MLNERSGLARRATPDSADGGAADDERADGAEVDDDRQDDGGAAPVADTDGGADGDGEGAIDVSELDAAGRKLAAGFADDPGFDGYDGITDFADDGEMIQVTPPATPAELKDEQDEENDDMSAKMKRYFTYFGIGIGGIVVGYVLAAATDSPVEGAIDRMIPG